MIITPDQSQALCWVRSPALARNTSAPFTGFQIVHALVPLWGFGIINTAALPSDFGTVGGPLSGPGSNISGSSTVPFVGYCEILYNDRTNPGFLEAWPSVYNTCTETWTQSDGNGATCTNSYSKYVDTVLTYSVVNTGSGPASGTIVSISNTSASVTILYTFGVGGNGTYTLQLSGSILQPSGVGPFVPSNATYGWQALTNSCLSILSSVSIPATNTPYSNCLNVVPISTGVGYNAGVINYDFRDTRTAALSPNLSTAMILAAANGFPLRSSNPPNNGGSNQSVVSIVNCINPFSNVPGFSKNYGACLCSKSKWGFVSGGLDLAHMDFVSGSGEIVQGSLGATPVVYVESVTMTPTPVAGSVSSASTQNPISVPSVVTFNAADVVTNLGSGTYGMMGFLSAAA